MRTLMIIGAGKAQVPLIEAAKRENYHTVVCDLNPTAPGVSIADKYCRVSTKDRDGLLSVAKNNEIHGVVANSEYAMCDVAYITENLGLVGNSEYSIAILSSKSRFREAQKQAGLYAPRFVTVAPYKQYKQLDENDIFFPNIIKPDMSSGSRGTVLIAKPENIENDLIKAMKISRNGKAIIEEYVPMPSYSVIEGEIFINHGTILWDGLFKTLRSQAAPTLPVTYLFPLPETEARINAAKKALTRAFQAVGIIHGEYNAELYFTDTGEPFIIEINPRQGGYELPRLVQDYCGIDYNRLLVTTSMGDDGYWESLKQFKRENRKIIHHMLFPRGYGRSQGIWIAEDLRDKVYQCQINVGVGDIVGTAVDADSCIGFVDLEFDSIVDQLETSSRIEELITLEVV